MRPKNPVDKFISQFVSETAEVLARPGAHLMTDWLAGDPNLLIAIWYPDDRGRWRSYMWAFEPTDVNEWIWFAPGRDNREEIRL